MSLRTFGQGWIKEFLQGRINEKSNIPKSIMDKVDRRIFEIDGHPLNTLRNLV